MKKSLNCCIDTYFFLWNHFDCIRWFHGTTSQNIFISWKSKSMKIPMWFWIDYRPIHLYLIFEKSSLKIQVRRTGFLTCKNQFQNWFLQATQAVKIQFKSMFVILGFSNFQKWPHCTLDLKAILLLFFFSILFTVSQLKLLLILMPLNGFWYLTQNFKLHMVNWFMVFLSFFESKR